MAQVAQPPTTLSRRSTTRSAALFQAAQRHLPGGVNSPVRAFRGVGGTPLFVDRAAGARVWDADGNEYVDYVASWGPLIAGHAHPDVVSAIQRAAARGTTYGAPTEAEVQLAVLVKDAFPSIELVRFVSSGTEATMSALRLARAATRRELIVKFDGGYHGHADGLLVQAGSGPLTLGAPDSPGVPAAAAAQTLSLPYNDLAAAARAFDERPNAIAAVIVEPVAGNMGVIPSTPVFLSGLRDLCTRHGALLILDEVITGFRVGWGGAQQRYDVTPDLTCLGKIVGGGLPVGAYGGRADLMRQVAPLGPVYQAGTLSGNPLAMAAGIATLQLLQRPGTYEMLEQRAARLEAELGAAARDAGIPYVSNRVGSMLTGFFTEQPVVDYASAKTSDTVRYARFFHSLLDRGVYFAPSQFEAAFVSLAHSDEELSLTVAAAREAFAIAAGAA
ncbi:MAG TPA: glutamate-1-semialdehyde 2,1-aminomutase [Chloroflexota bacterium]|nr:glutamate-1-semialdehyde 2,1-aminomutase [Chloroflexota bacterium]